MSLSELRLQAIKEMAKQSGLQLAQTIAVEKVAGWIGDEVRENALDSLEERIGQSCCNTARAVLERNPILLQENCNIEREQIIIEVQALASKMTKTSKHTRIINELASGVFKAASSSGSRLGTALFAAHKAGSFADSVSKIEPIINDIKIEIENIIKQAAVRAQQRLKVTSASATTSSNDASIKEALSSRIGSIVSSSVINLVQRKITAPLVSSGVNYVVDQSLQGYHKKQQEVLASYTQAIAAKTYQNELTADIIDKPADISQKAGSLSSDEVARIKALQRSPLAAESCDQFISQLSEELKQPIYFFQDGKLVKSYGLSQTGKAISIAYDSQSGQYLNLSAKESSNSSSIYQALAKAQDVYGTSELVKMHQGLMDTGDVINKSKGKESSTTGHPQFGLEPIDYTLLLQAKAKQEEIELSRETAGLLESIFNVSSRQTQSAHIKGDNWTIEDVATLFDADLVVNTYQPTKQHYISVNWANRESSSSLDAIKIYDIKSPAGKDNTSYSFGINSAEASSFAAPTTRLLTESLPVWESATILGGKYILKKGIKMVPVVGTAVGASYLYYSGDYSPGNIAKNLIPYADLAYDAYSAYQYVKTKFTAVKESVPESIVSGNSPQIIPIWKVPGRSSAINFKEMARIDQQGRNASIVPYIDLDPNAGKPTICITPIPPQLKPIIITPDDRELYLEWSKLPGFTPYIEEPWQESFPDHSDIANSMNILFKKINLDHGKLSERYFDDHLRYLYTKKYEGANIRDIDQLVREHMAELINRDSAGRIIGIHNTQDHHIVHQSIQIAPKLFEYLGLDIDSSDNRMILPADIEFTTRGLTKMVQHIGRHENDALDPIKFEVNRITRELKNNTVSKEQAKEELLRFIQEEKNRLESSEKYLNSVGRDNKWQYQK